MDAQTAFEALQKQLDENLRRVSVSAPALVALVQDYDRLRRIEARQMQETTVSGPIPGSLVYVPEDFNTKCMREDAEKNLIDTCLWLLGENGKFEAPREPAKYWWRTNLQAALVAFRATRGR